MRRALSIAGPAVAATVAAAGLAAGGQPVLRSAAQTGGHVVVAFTVGDLMPGQIQVATRPDRSRSGGFLAGNLVLSEVVTTRPDPATGLVRWRTRQAVPRRTLYVQVSGFETAGVTGCKPPRHCGVHWSNVRLLGAHRA